MFRLRKKVQERRPGLLRLHYTTGNKSKNTKQGSDVGQRKLPGHKLFRNVAVQTRFFPAHVRVRMVCLFSRISRKVEWNENRENGRETGGKARQNNQSRRTDGPIRIHSSVLFVQLPRLICGRSINYWECTTYLKIMNYGTNVKNLRFQRWRGCFCIFFSFRVWDVTDRRESYVIRFFWLW